MKKLLLCVIIIFLGIKSHAQTNKNWYGYPDQRQTSALAGGVVGSISYSVSRSIIPNEPKWKSMLVSTAFTTGTSVLMYSVYNISPVDRRQNFTASMLSGISITLIFSLGI